MKKYSSTEAVSAMASATSRTASLKLCLGIVLLSSLLLPSAPHVLADEESLSETGFFLDTVISITIYGSSDSTVMDGCFSLLDDYEQLFSRTIEGSDVWKINHSSGEPTEVDSETAALIEASLYYSEISNGKFDITVTPLAELWDIENNTGYLPSDEEIQEALSHVDYTVISVDGAAVTLADPEAEIDLGGIAKGYIADRLKDYLKSEGITSALINLGGNVLTLGEKPNGNNWKIGIRKPFGESSSDLIAVVETADMAVITSGTYERYFELDGVIYHHILDTETGYPVENGLTSVTILSESSTEGDALSTTCFVLGLEDGMELVEATDGVEALFITNEMELYRSSGFPED
ncbi:MAG: FAD:protein FMN transferase [Lachnospiraceae bacterium]|nr:FAD:protein FMN transferase [Lachnospiraceae bacterium]